VQAWAAHEASTASPPPVAQLAGARLCVSPNPVWESARIGYALPAGCRDAELALYDVAGRRVKTLASPGALTGAGSRIWDGRDEAGRPVATGIYFARLSAGEGVLTTRVVRIR